MNNEEKIMSILETLTQGQARIETDLSGLKSDVADLKQGQVEASQRFDKLELGQVEASQRFDKLELGQVEASQRFDKLELGQVETSQCFDKLELDVATIKSDVKHIKRTIDYLVEDDAKLSRRLRVLEAK